MQNQMYGYVRVSSKEQNEDRQLIAMDQYGVKRENVVVEKMSGKDFERPQYQKLLSRMREGDLLVIKSIDRLGRNYTEILEQWRLITKVRKLAVSVIDMPLLDTRGSRDLTGLLISDIVLQLLSYVAQTEREFIRQRQKEGIAAAKARGVKFGPQRIRMPADFEKYAILWKHGGISSRHAADILGISYQTFLRRAKEWNRSEQIANQLVDNLKQVGKNSSDWNYPIIT